MTTLGVTKLLKLNTGATIPQLGFGTWQAAPGVVGASVEDAVKAGFRHIDCAFIYRNQPEIGASFKKLFDAKVVERKDLFIVTKLWNTDHAPADVEPACRLSLAQLGLEYIDLYLIHWPVAWKHPAKYETDGDYFPESEAGGSEVRPDVSLADTWAAMEQLVAKGLVKAIGVSNTSLEQLEALSKTWKIVPAVNQIEVQPFLPNRELIDAQRKIWGIETMAYCPLGVGMGTDAAVVEKGVFQHPKIVEIAAEAKMSAAALCLQWNLQKGNVVLSKSTNAARIAENAALKVDALTPEVVAKVDALFAADGKEYKRRVCNPGMFLAEPRLFFEDEWAKEA